MYILAGSVFFIALFVPGVAYASPPSGPPVVVVGGLCVGVVFLALFGLSLLLTARLLKRLRAGRLPTMAQPIAGLFLPHFSLLVALVMSLGLRLQYAWLAQCFGVALLVALVHAGLSDGLGGGRDRCLRFCSRPRLRVLTALIALVWVITFAGESLDGGIEPYLAPPIASLVVLLVWLLYRAFLAATTWRLAQRQRYEGTWRETPSGFALQVTSESFVLKLPPKLLSSSILEVLPVAGETCVIFAHPTKAGEGPFRTSTCRFPGDARNLE